MSPLFEKLGAPDDALALTVDGHSRSWHQVAMQARAQAASLKSLGLSPGTHVGLFTQNAIETLVAAVANAAYGFVTVPVDPKLGAMELGHIIGDARPQVMLAADPQSVADKVPQVRTLALASLQTHGVGEAPPFRTLDDAPMLVLYTSGTTGLPKGALISARNVASNLDALATAWRWTSRDTVVHALPLFHVHGRVLGLFGSLRVGGALHWVPKFSPEAVAQALATGTAARPTMLFAVPTMYHRLAEAAEASSGVRDGLKAARVLVSGSAALPNRDQLRIEALTGQRVLERYGLTETLINCALRAGGVHVVGSVGAPLEGVEVRLVDDARQPLRAPGDDTIGEIAVGGPNVFRGYLNRPEATAAVIDAEGWFYTGDLATQRSDGLVRIVGRRATDLIKCGGYKVGAGEVEAALLEHPLVREAAVVGLPDPDLGEAIGAWLVTSAPVSVEAVQDHVARLLSPHKRPRVVTFVSELPRNAMGKVLKARLKGS